MEAQYTCLKEFSEKAEQNRSDFGEFVKNICVLYGLQQVTSKDNNTKISIPPTKIFHEIMAILELTLVAGGVCYSNNTYHDIYSLKNKKSSVNCHYLNRRVHISVVEGNNFYTANYDAVYKKIGPYTYYSFRDEDRDILIVKTKEQSNDFLDNGYTKICPNLWFDETFKCYISRIKETLFLGGSPQFRESLLLVD